MPDCAGILFATRFTLIELYDLLDREICLRIRIFIRRAQWRGLSAIIILAIPTLLSPPLLLPAGT